MPKGHFSRDPHSYSRCHESNHESVIPCTRRMRLGSRRRAPTRAKSALMTRAEALGVHPIGSVRLWCTWWSSCDRGTSRQCRWPLQELAGLAQEEDRAAERRTRLLELIAARRAQRSPSRAAGIRRQLIATLAAVRPLLVAVGSMTWNATGGRPGRWRWPPCSRCAAPCRAQRLGADRTFLELPWRERLFLPDERWEVEARRHHARLQRPAKAANPVAPLLVRVRAGVDAGAVAVRSVRGAWTMSRIWRRWRPTTKTAKSADCAAGWIDASARCHRPRSSGRRTPRCAPAGSCPVASQDPARNC